MKTTTTTTIEALPGGLTLRPLLESDAQQYHALLEQPTVFAQLYSHMPHRTLEETREWLAHIEPPLIAIAATVGDVLVGGAEIEPCRMRRAHAASIGLAVHEAWRNRGIGKRLMAELIDIADNWLGMRRLELHVFVDNERAIDVYCSFGFEIEARHRGSVVRDGMLADMYLMGRLHDAIPFSAMLL
jgi:putative acetyltransferase